MPPCLIFYFYSGIAWSKTGTIASILPGGQSLELRYIRADPKDGIWGLSDPTPFAPCPNLSGGPLVHLSWSPTNTSSELAVIDAVGRVLIYSFVSHLNRPTLIRRWDADPIDDLHAVVGTYWLNMLPQHPSKVSKYWSCMATGSTDFSQDDSRIWTCHQERQQQHL